MAIWSAGRKPKDEKEKALVKSIGRKMKNLEEKHQCYYNPELEEMHGSLKAIQWELFSFPKDSLGMKKLKELSLEEQQEVYQNKIVPDIDEDGRYWYGHDASVEMTFEKWKEIESNDYVWDTMPKDIWQICFGSVFCSPPKRTDFDAYHIVYSKSLPQCLIDKAWESMGLRQALLYASELQAFKEQWEIEHPELTAQIQDNRNKLKEFEKDICNIDFILMKEIEQEQYRFKLQNKYGKGFIIFFWQIWNLYMSYRACEEASKWLRFWGDRGHPIYSSECILRIPMKSPIL